MGMTESAFEKMLDTISQEVEENHKNNKEYMFYTQKK